MAVVDKEDKERVARSRKDIAIADSDVERNVGGIESQSIDGCTGSATARPMGEGSKG